MLRTRRSSWNQSAAVLLASLPVVAGMFAAPPALAANRTWIGGNVDWVDATGNSNWTPGVEPGAGDDVFFNTPNTVNLGSNNSILSLSLSNGIDLNTNGFDLGVNGAVTLGGSSTNLLIDGSGSALSADSVIVNALGTIQLLGGTLNFQDEAGVGVITNNVAGSIVGNGTIHNGDALAAATTVFNNTGTLSARGNPGVIPPVSTLLINASNTFARLDLDGAAENGVVNVFRNQTLDIDIPLSDSFDGDINLFHNSVLDIASQWTLLFGTIDVDNGFIDNPSPQPDVPAGVAFIRGPVFNQTAGTITVMDSDGTLQFDAPYIVTSGNLVNNGLVIFNNNASISSSGNFTMPSGRSSITVNAGFNVNIDQPDFDADGLGTGTNVITINAGALLDLDLGAGADEGLTGIINLNGGELSVTTADNNWGIDGNVNVGPSSGNAIISGDAVVFSFNTTSVGVSSTLQIVAPNTWGNSSNAVVAAGAVLSLNGAATLSGAGTSFTGPGFLRFNSGSTVAANTTIDTGTFDWDGSTDGHLHTINDGVVFTINSPLFDLDGDMDDNITVGGSGAGFAVNGPASWQMKRSLTTNTPGVGSAVIAGTSRMVLTGSLADFNVNGTTGVSAPITFGPSSLTTIAALATLTVTGNAIYDGGTITGAGTYNPPAGNTVEATSTISATNFDFDRGTWVIQPGVTLNVNVGDYDPAIAVNGFGGTITINSGFASVFTADPQFVMIGNLNLNNTTGAPAVWSGEPLAIGDDNSAATANLTVGGTGVSLISPAVDFNADANVVINPGATLVLTGQALFESNNGAANAQFTGAGTFIFESDVAFSETTTINMVGGTVDLDGRDSDLTGNLIVINAPLVINAAAVSSFGKVNSAGVNGIAISSSLNSGALTVNLDSASASWTINAPGVISLSNDNAPATLLAGSTLNMDGTMNVSGDVRVDARLDIGGTININTAGEPLRLNGGSQTTTGANRLSGGTIQGAGVLGADTGRALFGFGTINTTIDFDGNATLRADDGILTITGAIVDLQQLGTLDTDGILNIPAAWNSNVATQVLMAGGEIRGGTITNDNVGGIIGLGLVSARVINNTVLNATSSSAPLIIETAANNNDWDGAANTGELRASTGNLTVRDIGLFVFQGTATVNATRTLFADGFELDFDPGSTLNLTGGNYRSSVNISTDLGGTINVNAGPESSLSSDGGIGSFDFEATSTTTLTGVLLLNSSATIQAGATFSGGGTLRNQATRTLSPASGADVNVLLDNRGLFAPAGTAQGRVDVKDYQQTSTGRIVEEIAGTGINQFDRLVVNGIAQLAGSLDVDLAGGFVPAIGQSFNILNATGGVLGTFSTVTQPDPVGPLEIHFVFTPNYQPTLVSLEVTRAFYEVQSGPYPQAYAGTNFELIKTTPATATLSGNNTYTGLTTVFGGTLVFANLNSLGEGGLDIRANGVAQFSPGFSGAVRLASLTIDGAPDAWAGKLDITDNDMVVRSTPAARLADLARINNQVKSGLNEAGGAFWTGNGITSSTAAANAGGTLTAVGIILNDFAQAGLPAGPIYTNFNGVPVTANDILGKYTWFGDADLSGVVDGTDYFLIDQAFSAGTLNGGWLNGDFSYDGKVDGTDYFLIDNAFGAQTGPLGGGAAAVPEPGAIGLLLGSLIASGQRRRRRIEQRNL